MDYYSRSESYTINDTNITEEKTTSGPRLMVVCPIVGNAGTVFLIGILLVLHQYHIAGTSHLVAGG